MDITRESGSWPAIAVVGAGAVGCYFGGMLGRAGAPVTLIGRARHMEAVAAHGLLLDTLTFQERIAMRTSTELSAAAGAPLVLFCVKTVDTESVAAALRPHLAPGAAVVSLQNGVDNVARMQAAAQLSAIAAVVYVAAAMVEPGHVKHSGRGDLVIPGPASLAGVFERAGVPCRVSPAIESELWIKMIINCAYNAVSALGRSRYGPMRDSSTTRDLMASIIAEAVAVARAEGVALNEPAIVAAAGTVGEAMRGATSSTAQDIARGRLTEIDSLNGYVVRAGSRHGIPTPVNRTLWALTKLLESSSAEAAAPAHNRAAPLL